MPYWVCCFADFISFCLISGLFSKVPLPEGHYRILFACVFVSSRNDLFCEGPQRLAGVPVVSDPVLRSAASHMYV